MLLSKDGVMEGGDTSLGGIGERIFCSFTGTDDGCECTERLWCIGDCMLPTDPIDIC